mgnify:FL=1
MKRILALIAVVGLLSFGILASTASAASTSVVNRDIFRGSAMVAKDQTNDGSYYAFAQTVTIDGTVNGDVYCVAQDVFINGTVNGDVICAGQRVTVSGTVKGDVRIVGQDLDINGAVGGSVSSLSQRTTVAKEAVVKGGVNGVSQRLIVRGTIEKDITVGARDLMIAGQVKGDVQASVGRLELTGSSSVRGSLSYRSVSELDIDKSRVVGSVVYTAGGNADRGTLFGFIAVSFVGLILFASVVSSVVLIAIAPRYYERSFRIINKKIGYVVLIGCVSFLGIPFVALTLMLTGVLLPLGLLVVLMGVMLHLLSFSFVAYYVGRWVFAGAVRHSILVMLAGAILVAIMMAIPFVCVLTFVAVHILGVGGLAITVVNGYKKPTYVIAGKK